MREFVIHSHLNIANFILFSRSHLNSFLIAVMVANLYNHVVPPWVKAFNNELINQGGRKLLESGVITKIITSLKYDIS